MKAGRNLCEEASVISGSFYIPCNRPAASLVKARDPNVYRMCETCADHNVRNRGARLVAPYKEFMMKEFVFKTKHATLESFLDMSMFFKDGELDKVETKVEDEVLIMSPVMFFAVFAADALELYEKAAEAHQNAALA